MCLQIDNLLTLLHGQIVIPVSLIDNIQNAVLSARALVKARLKTIDITLRIPNALQAIKTITQEIPEAIV